jgi:hypothetical protein
MLMDLCFQLQQLKWNGGEREREKSVMKYCHMSCVLAAHIYKERKEEEEANLPRKIARNDDKSIL